MTLLNILLIAIALSLDAAAVSAANGAHHHRMSFAKAVGISLLFGLFQFFMPLIGWLIGTGLETIVSQLDHWVAFILLSVLGVKMILESLKPVDEKTIDIKSIKILILLSVATSVDALIVGMTFAFLPINIWIATVVIGIVTFLLSLVSVYIGKKCGERWGRESEIFGGLILIAIGIRILFTHIFF